MMSELRDLIDLEESIIAMIKIGLKANRVKKAASTRQKAPIKTTTKPKIGICDRRILEANNAIPTAAVRNATTVKLGRSAI